MDEATTIENERTARLEQARNLKTLMKNKSRLAKAKSVISLGEKFSKHWLLLSGAAFFDLLGIIPVIGPVFNFAWGGVLFLKFGPKKFKKTALTMGLGSIADFFLGVLPVCLAMTAVKILYE